MHGLKIRQAQPHDLRPVNRIIESAVLNWPMEMRVKRLAVKPLTYDSTDLEHYEMLVAEFNGEIVGVAAWEASQALKGSPQEAGLLHGLYVLPLLQRQGIGQHLANEVFEQARARGITGIRVRAQRVSRHYFEHLGMDMTAANETEYPWQFYKALA